MKNKYIELYYADKDIKEYQRLYKQIEEIVEEIRNNIYEMGTAFQSICVSMIKDKRVFYVEGREEKDRYYKQKYDYGLGTYGFGQKTTWGTTLNYDWYHLHSTMKDIIKNEKKLKEGIKISYIDRFDKLIEALKLYPKFENKVKTYTDSFSLKDSEFWEDEPYKKGYISSELVRKYESNIVTKIIHKRKSNNNELEIEPDDIQDNFLYNHLYDMFIIYMKVHIDRLNIIDEMIGNYIKTKEYQDVLQEAINIRLLEKI